MQSESGMQASRQRIADLNATTIASLKHKVRDDVGGFLPFMMMESLNLSQLAMAESDIAAAWDGMQQAVAQLRWGGTGDRRGTDRALDRVDLVDANCRTRRWELAPWARATAAREMDGVEKGPDPDGTDWDEISTSIMLFGDAYPCVKYPCWLGRRA
jgi:hypothetical protein